MSRRGTYIGGSTIIRTGNLCGPEQDAVPTDHNIVAFPVPIPSGNRLTRKIKELEPAQPLMAPPNFLKFKNQLKEIADLLMYIDIKYVPQVLDIREIYFEMCRIEKRKREKSVQRNAATLIRNFYALTAQIDGSKISKARIKKNESE